jgi:hypothetical protein
LLNFAFLPNIAPAFTVDTLEIDYVRIYQSAATGLNIESDNQQIFDLKTAPNPASDYIIISYYLPENTDVNIEIRDLTGRLIQILTNEKQSSGQHQAKWNTQNLSSGVYFLTLNTGNNIMTKKCIISK